MVEGSTNGTIITDTWWYYKVRKNGAWSIPENVKRHTGSAWTRCTEVKVSKTKSYGESLQVKIWQKVWPPRCNDCTSDCGSDGACTSYCSGDCGGDCNDCECECEGTCSETCIGCSCDSEAGPGCDSH